MAFIDVLDSLTAGPRGWLDASRLTIGIAAALSKPSISEDLAVGDAPMINIVSPPTVARTMVFTAPVDCTIRQLVFQPTQTAPTALVDALDFDVVPARTLIGDITVAGTGPDVGDWVEGYGVPSMLFSVVNIERAPQLNLRLDAGDTVTITLFYIGGVATPPIDAAQVYHALLTYDVGQDSRVTPTYFIGGTTEFGGVGSTSATPATGTITITGTPTSPGDYITLLGNVEGVGGGTVGETLDGVAGGGGSGDNEWDTDIAGITPIRDAILAALQDSANDFDDGWTFVSSGADSIDITRINDGPFGNFDTFVSSGANISLTPGTGNLSGAAAGTTTIALETPSVDVVIDKVIGFTTASNAGTFPAIRTIMTPSFVALNVGGSPEASFAPSILNPSGNFIPIIQGEVTVPSSTSLSVDVRGPLGLSVHYYCVAGRLV